VLEFVDLRTTRHPGLLEAVHRDLFLPNFPDPDEQEGPDDWRPRLWEDPPPPQPEQHAFVAGTHLGSDARRALAGFAFVERYRESGCALLSYIAVESSQRRHGLARKLFGLALGSAKEAAQRDGRPVRATFAEIHDPWRVNQADEVIDPADRASIMERLGAWRVPISYVQPALDENSKRSDRLMLVAFPPAGERAVDADAVKAFLSEYFRALGIEKPADDPDLARMEKELKELGGDAVDLVPLGPSLGFKRFSVVLHFVSRRAPKTEGSDLAGAPQKRPEKREDVNPFWSFEDDLLSYRYVTRHRDIETVDYPFESQIVEVEDETVERVALTVPTSIRYLSEGRERRLYLPPLQPDGRQRNVAVRASLTYFPKSGYCVFHLAFVGPEQATPNSALSDVVLDEYDLVALSKLWQSGEWEGAASEICLDNKSVWKFAQGVFKQILDDYPELKEAGHSSEPHHRDWGLLNFLHSLLNGSKNEEASNGVEPRVRVGTIQLMTDDPTPGVEWATIWRSINSLVAEEDGKTAPAIEEVARRTTVGKQVTALGGIVQGILDFQAIDATELADVFKAHEVEATSLIGVHKGTLLCVMESDRSYDAAAERIGVSPYLLLPQAVLLHNEALLDDVASHADSVKPTRDRVRLEECFKAMRNLLACYVPNVFHYPQERRLLDAGERTRGLAERREELFETANEIERRWRVAVERRSGSAGTLRNVLLALIGLSTFPYVHGVGLIIGLVGLAVCLLILSLHSNQRWSWSSPRSWWSVAGDVVRRGRDEPGNRT
jgi:hypothetical protein